MTDKIPQANVVDNAVKTVVPRDRAASLIRKLLLELPLYAVIANLDDDIDEAVGEILVGESHLDFDLYCSACLQVTPWTVRNANHRTIGGASNRASYIKNPELPLIRVIHAVCQRKQHFYTYIIFRKIGYLQKIGQLPSMADIAFSELKHIHGINTEDRRELGRALGLYAHDAPLGAFVYLRRVFERMIERAHEAHRERSGTYISGWRDLRMGERIAALGETLPVEISQNAGVFGLLSKGIHELSDEDAATLFPLVKAVIFQMLGDEERHRQADLARKETKVALQEAISRFGSSRDS